MYFLADYYMIIIHVHILSQKNLKIFMYAKNPVKYNFQLSLPP